MPEPSLLVPSSPFVWHHDDEDERRLTLQSAAARTIVFRLHAGRLTVGMVVATRSSAIDISRQPPLLWGLLADAATQHDRNVNQLQQRVSAELRTFARAQRTWVPESGDVEGQRLSMAMSFPMLAPAVESGARPVSEVPSWAAPALAASTAREGASIAFGGRTTRRVVWSFANSLTPADEARGSIKLAPIALAIMGRDILDPDRIATVLDRAVRVDVEPRWPDVDLVELAWEQFPTLGADRVARLLRDTAEAEDGMQRLRTTLSMLRATRTQLPAALPSGLSALHDLCVSYMPTDPNPRPAAAARPPSTPHARPRRQRPVSPDRTPAVNQAGGATNGAAERQVCAVFGDGTRTITPPPPAEAPAQALHAPRASRTPTSNRISYPPSVRAVDRVDLPRRLQLVLPRTKQELVQWGHMLRNCIGTFDDAAVRGISTIIGVRHDGRLTYCLELNAAGEIRQFLGVGNRRVPTLDAATVVQALLDHGLAARTAPNEPWIRLTANDE